jgi:outer membrane protein assembly factor BamB
MKLELLVTNNARRKVRIGDIVVSCVLVLAHTGCGRKHEVDVISPKESGVVLTEMDSDLAENDWGGWRGPGGDGIAAPQEIVTTWDETTNVLWRADVPGRGHSSPIVVGDLVFLATAIKAEETQCVIAYYRVDGTEQWRTVLHRGGFPASGEVHQKATNANGTIASDGRHLYIAMLNSKAIIASALDLDGKLLWQQEVGKFASRFGYAPSPVLYKSLVIFAADNAGGGYLAALDGASGKVAWRVSRGRFDSYSSPAIANVGGRDQLLISGCDAVTSYDPATGEELWRTPCIAEATCGTIVTKGDRILASGGFPEMETVCLSAQGEMIWSNSEQIYEPSMIVSGDYVVGVNDDGVATCWEIESGEQQWKKRLGGNFSASPVLVDDLVIVPNLEGSTFVFRAGEEFEEIAENRLGDDAYASPAVAGGQIFLRIGVGKGTDRHEQLVCIGDSGS